MQLHSIPHAAGMQTCGPEIFSFFAMMHTREGSAGPHQRRLRSGSWSFHVVATQATEALLRDACAAGAHLFWRPKRMATGRLAKLPSIHCLFL